MQTTHRITAGLAGLGAATVLGFGLAGAATAGTMPITRPGEPTVAMTLTNHTDKTQYLIGATPGQGGSWVNAPKTRLAPGASETITATAPFANQLTVNAQYRVGLGGPVANYEIHDSSHNVNTQFTGVSGNHAGNYWIHTNISSHYPNANVGYDLW